MATMRRLSLSLSMMSLLFFVSPLRADDYVSKEFPSEEIMMKNLQNYCSNAFKISKILGKYQTNDGVYQVVALVESQGASRMHATTVIKLDTDIWIINPSRCNEGVVQK
jgi:hypothetical protein